MEYDKRLKQEFSARVPPLNPVESHQAAPISEFLGVSFHEGPERQVQSRRRQSKPPAESTSSKKAHSDGIKIAGFEVRWSYEGLIGAAYTAMWAGLSGGALWAGIDTLNAHHLLSIDPKVVLDTFMSLDVGSKVVSATNAILAGALS